MCVFACKPFKLLVMCWGISFVLSACGELDTVLPSRGTYSVNALVDTIHTLEEYPILNSTSKVRPFFENSVTDDPDVRGLVVFIQNLAGIGVTRKIYYELATNQPVYTSRDTAGVQTNPGKEAVPADSGAAAEKNAAPVTPVSDTGASEARSVAEEDTAPVTPASDTGASEADSVVEEDTAPAVPASDTDASEDMVFGEPDAAEFPISELLDDRTVQAETGPEAAEFAGIDGSSDETDGFPENGISGVYESPFLKEETDAGSDPVEAGPVDRENTETAGYEDLPDKVEPEDIEISAGDSSTEEADAEEDDPRGVPSYTGAVEEKDMVTETVGSDKSSGTVAETTLPAEVQGAAGNSTETVSTSENTAKTEIENLPDLRFQVTRLDQYLPAFQILEKLEIGQYTLVFQVMGEREEVLYKTMRPIYFLRNAKFALGEIQSFLPKAFEGSRLIPPETNIILEAAVDFDTRLDPYVIWYNGKKVIAEGRVSENTNQLLWKTPEQTGFHTIRVEVFPLRTGDKLPKNIFGQIKEISLPISSKYDNMAYFSNDSSFVYWYQLPGTLNDAIAPNNVSKQLVPPKKKPRWSTFAKSYGLVIGPEDIYTLPGEPFVLLNKEEGSGEILFHLIPVREGTILKASFDMEDSASEKLILSVSANRTYLTLRLSAGTTAYETTLDLAAGSDFSGFVMGSVVFQAAPDHFSARLNRKNPDIETNTLTLALEHPLSGKGIVQIGDADLSRHRRNTGDTQVAILNELAVSFSKKAVVLSETKQETAAVPVPKEKTGTEGDRQVSRAEASEDRKEKTENIPPSPLAEGGLSETETAPVTL
jgi:hypothetical protein